MWYGMKMLTRRKKRGSSCQTEPTICRKTEGHSVMLEEGLGQSGIVTEYTVPSVRAPTNTVSECGKGMSKEQDEDC